MRWNCFCFKPGFKTQLLSNEQQMSECYEPVKLYRLNKQLMDKCIGTCRVEDIQIIERIIGPVEYLNDENNKNRKDLYLLAPKYKQTKFNTVNLELRMNQKVIVMNTIIIFTIDSSKNTNLKSQSKTPKVKLSVVCNLL